MTFFYDWFQKKWKLGKKHGWYFQKQKTKRYLKRNQFYTFNEVVVNLLSCALRQHLDLQLPESTLTPGREGFLRHFEPTGSWPSNLEGRHIMLLQNLTHHKGKLIRASLQRWLSWITIARASNFLLKKDEFPWLIELPEKDSTHWKCSSHLKGLNGMVVVLAPSFTPTSREVKATKRSSQSAISSTKSPGWN